MTSEHVSWRIVDRGFLNDTRNLGLRFSRAPIGRSHLVVLATLRFSQIERYTSGLMTTTEKPIILLASLHFITTYWKLCEQHMYNRERPREGFRSVTVYHPLVRLYRQRQNDLPPHETGHSLQLVTLGPDLHVPLSG